MAWPLPDLSAPDWTPELASRLERASAAVGRLDARVSASSLTKTWRERVSLGGFARALRSQGSEIDEIDIFAHQYGVAMPDRASLPWAVSEEFAGIASWQLQLLRGGGRHWREDFPVTFDPPEGWSERPLLLRALQLTALHARAVVGKEAWLAFPGLLQRLGMTRGPLPCLIPADKALHLNPRDAKAIIPRYLRALADQAETGLERLDGIEADRRRSVVALSQAQRPGNLAGLTALLMVVPAVSPSGVAKHLRMSISGAGKLLDRAAGLGLAVEISGRQAWRIYLAPEAAIAFGFTRRPRGRPPSPPSHLPADLDRLLAEFDAAVATFDESLDRARLGRREQDSSKKARAL